MNLLDTLPPVLDVDQAAAVLRCEPETVNEACRARELPALKYGRGWILPAAALLDYLNRAAAAHVKQQPTAAAAAPGAAVLVAAPPPPQRAQQRRRGPLPVLPQIPGASPSLPSPSAH